MKKVKIGIVGLGGLGAEHAKNIAYKIPNAELTAVCRTNEKKLKEFAEKWEVPYAYTSYEEMIKNPELDAVVIVSPSHLHGEQIKLALDAGLHVFCEKPLGVTVEECKIAEKAVEEHSEKVFMLGYMRRYDPSYSEAKAKIEAGEIGKVMLVKFTSCDPETSIPDHLKAAAHSGKWFQEMTPHDIDLARWLIKSEPMEVYSAGSCYEYKEFEQYEDGDNVFAMMRFKNETVAFFHSGRNAQHGYHVETEIVGTKGTIRVGGESVSNMNILYNTNGIVKECIPNYRVRFAQAFVNEMQEFVDCILEERKPKDLTVYDGTRVTEIANAATESFAKRKLITLS